MARYTEWLQKKFVGDPKLGAEYLSLARTLLGGLHNYSKNVMSNVRHVTLPNGVKITVSFAGAINRVLIDVRSVTEKIKDSVYTAIYVRPSWSGLFDFGVTVYGCGVSVKKVSRKPFLKYVDLRAASYSDVVLTNGQNNRNTYCVTLSNSPQYFPSYYDGTNTVYLPTRINGNLVLGWGFGFSSAKYIMAAVVTNMNELAVLRFDRATNLYSIVYIEQSQSQLLARAQQTRVVFDKSGKKFAYFDKLNSLIVRELTENESGNELSREVTYPLSPAGGSRKVTAVSLNSYSYHAVGFRSPPVVVPWLPPGTTYIDVEQAQHGVVTESYEKIPIACDFDIGNNELVVLYATQITTTTSGYDFSSHGTWTIVLESGGCEPYPTTLLESSDSSGHEVSKTTSNIVREYKLFINNKEIYSFKKNESSTYEYEKTNSSVSSNCCSPVIGGLYCKALSSSGTFQATTSNSYTKIGDPSIPYLISFDLRYRMALVYEDTTSTKSSYSASLGDDLVSTTITTKQGKFKLCINNTVVDIYTYSRPTDTVVTNNGEYSTNRAPVEGETGDVDNSDPYNTTTETAITKFTLPYYANPNGDPFNSMAEMFAIDHERAIVYIRDQDNGVVKIFLVCEGAAKDVTDKFEDLGVGGSGNYASIVSAYSTMSKVIE